MTEEMAKLPKKQKRARARKQAERGMDHSKVEPWRQGSRAFGRA